MGKDTKARRGNVLTVMALANLMAAIVDTMREAEVPDDLVHTFLDRLERMNALTLSGTAAHIMSDFVGVIRGTVPAND